LFKQQTLSLITTRTRGQGRFAPGEQMNIFNEIIQIFPKVLFFMVSPSAGNFMGKRFFPSLSTYLFQLLLILGLQLIEGGHKGRALIMLLGQELSLFWSQFHTKPLLRRKAHSVAKLFNSTMYWVQYVWREHPTKYRKRNWDLNHSNL